MDGARFKFDITEPFHFEIEEDDHGTMLPMLDSSPLLITEELLQALREAGVDNMDIYDTEIYDEVEDKIYTNYKAVNIIGMVSATDASQSKIRKVGDQQSGILINWVDELVLDESRTRGLLMFRLAEKPSFIFVHDSVKNHLLKRGFDQLSFIPPEEVV